MRGAARRPVSLRQREHVSADPPGYVHLMPDDHEDLNEENRRRLAAVTLSERTQNDVWSRVTAHISADGSLVIFAHDIGPKASLIGDEMEYWVKVEQQHLNRLAILLAALLGTAPTSGAMVPTMLKLAFERGDFETGGGVREWLTANGIPSAFSSWP